MSKGWISSGTRHCPVIQKMYQTLNQKYWSIDQIYLSLIGKVLIPYIAPWPTKYIRHPAWILPMQICDYVIMTSFILQLKKELKKLSGQCQTYTSFKRISVVWLHCKLMSRDDVRLSLQLDLPNNHLPNCDISLLLFLQVKEIYIVTQASLWDY